MKSPSSSEKQANIDIRDYYAIKVGSIWNGLKQESAAFWWLCIYLFFEYVRPQTIYPAIDIIPYGQVTFLLAFISSWVDQSAKWVRSPANVLIILFLLIVLLSGALAFKPSVSWEAIDIPIIWVMLFFLVVRVVNSEKRFLVFMLLFLLVNFKMSQHGAISFASRGFAFARWGVSGSPGWFQNAGDFGCQMTIFVPLAIAFILALKQYWGKYKKLFFYLFPLTGLVTILATSSRGAQLAIIVAALWAILNSKQRIKGVMGILIIGALLYTITPEKMLEKYSSSGEDSTSVARLTFWKYGLRLLGENPVIGVGYENWRWMCWYQGPFVEIEGVNCLDPHNTFIQAGAELGISGVAVYIIMGLLIFVINGRTRRIATQANNNFIRYTAFALDVGLVGYLVSSSFLTVLFYPMFWMQLAMTVALHNISSTLTEGKQLNEMSAK